MVTNTGINSSELILIPYTYILAKINVFNKRIPVSMHIHKKEVISEAKLRQLFHVAQNVGTILQVKKDKWNLKKYLTLPFGKHRKSAKLP